MFSIESIPADHPTPSLLVDADAVRENVTRMQRYCNENNLALRPHTKTHKSVWMAKMQRDCGAVGLTVAKMGEAAVMANVCSEILIAYPTIGQARLNAVANLSKSANLIIGIDSKAAAEMIAQAVSKAGTQVGILVDIDVGFHRTGMDSLQETLDLAEFVDRTPGLELQGLMCFPGHLLPSSDATAWEKYAESMGVIVESFRNKGLCADIVSGGSTPTACLSAKNPWLTEIRPGTYIYNDVNEIRLGVATLEQCAARVLATVVSRANDHKFVLDCGSKTLSSDRCGPAPESGFGYVVEYPTAKVTRLSEEHGEVELVSGVAPAIGSRVTIVPNHICVCVNLQDKYWLFDNQEWTQMPVDARGLLV
jgi:D-serine deaminase-like pyridoxal phosphate-dependent protein